MRLSLTQRSGLGLYITKGIVVQHTGAKIWAESEGEGHGCTFFVEIPTVVLDAAVVAVQSQDAERRLSLRRGGSNKSSRVASNRSAHVASNRSAHVASNRNAQSPRMKSLYSAEFAVQRAAVLQHAAEQGKDGDGADAGAEAAADAAEAVFRPLILVVDDSPLNRRMLCRMLELEGFDTVQVGRAHLDAPRWHVF